MQVRFVTKVSSFFCLLIGVWFIGSCVFNSPKHQVPRLFTHDGTLSQPLSELLKLDGIEHDGTLETIVKETQKKWLRPAGLERFQVSDVRADKSEIFMPLLAKIGLVDEVYPSQTSYDYCLILGATVSTVRIRIAYAVKLWNEGIRFKNLVFLSGARTLDPVLEKASVLCDTQQKVLPIRSDWKWNEQQTPVTETDMMKLVYDQAELPDSFRTIPLTVVDAPQQMGVNGVMRRPNTGDTIVAWLANNPTPGTCLVMSTQPFVGYQDTVVRTELPSTFLVETVGRGDDEDSGSVLVYLDSLARWLYQEQLYCKKS